MDFYNPDITPLRPDTVMLHNKKIKIIVAI